MAESDDLLRIIHETYIGHEVKDELREETGVQINFHFNAQAAPEKSDQIRERLVQEFKEMGLEPKESKLIAGDDKELNISVDLSFSANTYSYIRPVLKKVLRPDQV